MRRRLIVCVIFLALGGTAGLLYWSDPHFFDSTLPTPNTAPDPAAEARAIDARLEQAMPPGELAALEKDTRPVFSLHVIDVASGSQAEAAGMLTGDLIGGVDGAPVRGVDALADQTSGSDVYSVWSQNRGLCDISFKGKMGIWFDECWLPEVAYIHSKERNLAWDSFMISAARTWERDSPVALAALSKAKAAGYNGWLLPALSACMASSGGRHADALKDQQALRAALPKESLRPVAQRLYFSALLDARIELADELDGAYAEYYPKPIEWNPAPLRERFKQLSAADRAMLNAEHGLDHTLINDFSQAPERLNQNANIMFDYMNVHHDFGVSHSIDQFSTICFGPLLSNPALSMDFTVTPNPPNQTNGKGSFSIQLCDTTDGAATPLVEVGAHTDGQLALRVDGYPPIPFTSKEVLRLDGSKHHLEIYVAGPWLEVWMNGRRLILGLTPRRPRELYVSLVDTGVRAVFNNLTYGESKGELPAPPAQGPVSPIALTVPPEPQDPALRWFHHALVGGYLQGKHRNALWDGYAVNALSMLGRRWGHDPDWVDEFELMENLRKAVAAGCMDPLVQFAYGEMTYEYSDGVSPTTWHAYQQAAENLAGSNIHPLLQFAILNQWMRYEAVSELAPIQKRVGAQSAAAYALIPKIVADPDIPKTFLYGTFVERADRPHTELSPDRKLDFDREFAVLQRCAPDSSLALSVKGAFYVNYAWDARGNGWSKDVTQNGWALFNERLSVAEESLTAAWENDNGNAIAMAQLLTVGMGAGFSAERMKQTFERAMSADPYNLSACDKMIHALRPRWGGSCEQMEEFGLNCLQRASDPRSNEGIARYLVFSREYCADDEQLVGRTGYESETIKSAYWLQPEVWRDVQAVYDVLLKRRPKSRLYKSEYAFYASKCEHWSAAAKLLEELGDEWATAPFGGPQKAYAAKVEIMRKRGKGAREGF